ncbi:recombinase A [Planoprotostelium fungivorum]|uniref:Recombinase A n=1 Tax=Planoprotostelium fungivorum TaxID=1890364 RepID=A0A2P6NXP1_9EUKA|nr:recombinase A [Planoprotostelium fungivorum]
MLAAITRNAVRVSNDRRFLNAVHISGGVRSRAIPSFTSLNSAYGTNIKHIRSIGAKKKKAKSEEGSAGDYESLESAVKSIEASFGKGSIQKLSDSRSDFENVGVISTGSIGLDTALGIGGFPRGRIIEIYGPESSGKTTLALSVIASAHKNGGKCVFIDAEHSLDPHWAETLGVKIDELLVSQPDSGEQALGIAEAFVQSNTTDVIVIDSVAALVPKAELEGNMGDSHVGLQARLMSQALRKLTGALGKSNRTMIIFINQIRHKIGVMFGSPETTTGGNALKFYASARVDVRRVQSIKVGENIIGNQVRAKVVKNKLAAPYREALFDIEFGKGLSKTGELVDLGVKSRVLEKSGAWLIYQGEKLANGREKTKQYLEENPVLAEKIEAEVRDRLLHQQGEGGSEEEEAAEEAGETITS